MQELKGIAVSPGVAIGKVLMLQKEEYTIDMTTVDDAVIEQEIEAVKSAIVKSKAQIQGIYEAAVEKLGAEKAAIFVAHMDILEDPAMMEGIMEKVRNDKKNAAWAFDETVKEFCAMFDAIDDEYLRERASDLRDVGDRAVRNILGMRIVDLSHLEEPVVIVANDLMPSDTASMDIKKVLGFVTEVGGRTSHSSIMARSLEIPAVVGTAGILENAKQGDMIVVDGIAGDVFVNADEETTSQYTQKKQAYLDEREKLAQLRDIPAVTTDGRHIEMCANIGNAKDAEGAQKNGAEGIGLYRTEFLYMDNKQFPTEEEQFEAYKEVCEKMEGKPVIIRTLDIGGDKELPYYEFPKELNPFLGWRAIRIYLDHEDLFKTQLRAILRASAFGKIRIMFPMIISVDEFRRAKALLEACKQELRQESISFDDAIQTGIMVETPAAVLLAGQFAKEVDFFSIGTNDLTQYVLAVDRGNEKIAHLYNSFHPAVIHAIKMVIDASHKEGKWTGMCGEFAGEKEATTLLLGMGLDEFSMSAISIPVIKDYICKLSFEEAQKVAEDALSKTTADEVVEVLRQASAACGA